MSEILKGIRAAEFPRVTADNCYWLGARPGMAINLSSCISTLDEYFKKASLVEIIQVLKGLPNYISNYVDQIDGLVDSHADIQSGSNVDQSYVGDRVTVSRSAIVERSLIEAEVFISPGARITNSIVGLGARVGDGALVRDSIIGPQVSIGFGREIARTIVGKGARIEHQGVVVDSVIGDNALLTANTWTTNHLGTFSPIDLQLNEDHLPVGAASLGAFIGPGAKILAGVIIMPGVLIGQKAQIDPGVLLTRSVPDGGRVSAVQTYMVYTG